jgi:acetyl-CoA carboxylase beta subunit
MENGSKTSYAHVNHFVRCANCNMGYFIGVFLRQGERVCPHCNHVQPIGA